MPEPRCQRLDRGRIIVADGFAELLRANGLDRFENIMAHRSPDTMRSVPGRSTVRILLERPGDTALVAYLKRYEPQYLSARAFLLRAVHWPGADDEAMLEWRMIHRLRAAGFNTAEPIAAGRRQTCGVTTRSFLLTAGITGGVSAFHYLQSATAAQRRALTAALAELTRRFHRAGFIHKDFYLHHIFVVEQPDRPACLFLIDLQRVAGPGRFRRRWLVKDLAALAYTAQQVGVNRAGMMRFYKQCFECRRLGQRDKRLIRHILDRVGRLQRRPPRYDTIWDRPGLRPPNL
jgi:hypothetical protein